MPPPPPRGRPWLAAGLWFAVLIAVARAVLLFGMERVAHGSSLSLVRHRLALALPEIFAVAAVLGVAGAWTAARLAGRRAERLLAWLALSSAGWALLVGRLSADASRQVGLQTERGQLVAAAAAAVALALCGLLVGFVARERRIPAGHSAHSGRPGRWSLVPLAVVILVPLAARLGASGFASEMPLRRVVARIGPDASAWDVVAARSDREPHAGVLCPSLEYELDGSDMPGLVLPPPARVSFQIPGSGELRLALRAGIDHTVFQRYEERLAGHSVGFGVTVDGEPVFAGRVAVRSPEERSAKWPGSEWLDVAPGGRIDVRGGQTVELATELRGPDGAEVAFHAPLTAGFGGVAVERHWTQPRTRATPEEPNVVLIVMDTQRADRLSAYGYERPTSPYLDGLAARGTLFENVYSTSSWTWPSTASILTGRLPQEHGVTSEASCFLADELETLPEVLQAAGLTTGGFSANPLIVPDRNFDQGFEVFEYGKGATRDTSVVLPPALEWLEAVADTRFFLYLHLADPHAPLSPLPEGRELLAADVPRTFSPYAINEYQDVLLAGDGHDEHGRPVTERAVPAEHQEWISDLYDACVWSGDRAVGHVLDTLERLGLTDRTLVAFTSDHGEELFDHGFAAHGQNVHGSLVRVPLILAGPSLPVGQRVEEPVSNRHLAATLARLAGAGAFGPPETRDLFAEPPPEARAPIFFSTEKGWWNGRQTQPIHGLREGDWLLHFAPEGGPWRAEEPSESGQWRLYDLATDPAERTDLAPERVEKAASLRRAVQELLDELERRRTAPAVGAGEATLEMLRGIGYLDE